MEDTRRRHPRAFVEECERTAREVREDLSIGPVDPLPPLVLADHLETPVVPLTHLLVDAEDDLAAAVALFRGAERHAWSALRLNRPTGPVIVVNDSHSPARIAFSTSHEVAHGLLLHVPGPALDRLGCRYWDKQAEDEADWLASALLLPRPALRRAVRNQWSKEEIARVYGVSRALVTWRINMNPITAAGQASRR